VLLNLSRVIPLNRSEANQHQLKFHRCGYFQEPLTFADLDLDRLGIRPKPCDTSSTAGDRVAAQLPTVFEERRDFPSPKGGHK
jgi:hypothetical protein